MSNERDAQSGAATGGIGGSGSMGSSSGIGGSSGTSGSGAATGSGMGATGATDSGSMRGQLADSARSAAGSAKDAATQQVRSGLDLGKERAASALHGVAESLRRSCDERQDGATRYLMQAGDRVQRTADYLERTDVRDMVSHTEQFARRQPVLFIGAAFTLGLAAARFLKSSQRQGAHGQADAWSGGAPRAPQYDRQQPLSTYQEGTGAGSAASYGGAQGASQYGSGSSYGSGASYGSGSSYGGSSAGGASTGGTGTSSSGGTSPLGDPGRDIR